MKKLLFILFIFAAFATNAQNKKPQQQKKKDTLSEVVKESEKTKALTDSLIKKIEAKKWKKKPEKKIGSVNDQARLSK